MRKTVIDLHGMTWLLIDDDADDREFFLLAIEALEHQVNCLTRSNPLQALDEMISGELKADIVFVDMRMPALSGSECARRIRQIPAYRTAPLILYSTSNPDYGQEQVRLSGATDFFTKPSSIPELSQILESVYQRYRTNRI